MSFHNGFDFLEPHPGSAYRQLFIRGTLIRAGTVFRATQVRDDNGQCAPPADIAEDYGIPVGAVYEAMRYCESNPIEIAMDQRAEELLLEAQGLTRTNHVSNGHKPMRAMSAEVREHIQKQLELEFGPPPGKN